jgi:hypothetical protein
MWRPQHAAYLVHVEATTPCLFGTCGGHNTLLIWYMWRPKHPAYLVHVEATKPCLFGTCGGHKTLLIWYMWRSQHPAYFLSPTLPEQQIAARDVALYWLKKKSVWFLLPEQVIKNGAGRCVTISLWICNLLKERRPNDPSWTHSTSHTNLTSWNHTLWINKEFFFSQAPFHCAIYTSVFIQLNPSNTTCIMIIKRLKRQHVSTVNSHPQALLNSFVNYSVSAHMGCEH